MSWKFWMLLLICCCVTSGAEQRQRPWTGMELPETTASVRLEFGLTFQEA